jgi:glycosyltransferase involved in cell wall biosynthesis
MKLSIIVPAFNEERTIGDVLTRLIKIKDIYEIVVVNDSSTDGTSDKVESIKDKRIRLINQPRNLGKGAAVRTGLAAVNGDYVLIQDADSEYDPYDIPVMISPVTRGRAEVVYGSRFFGIHTNMFYWHLLGNKFLNWMVNILYNSILSDMETGYKLIPTKLFRSLNLTSNDFRIEPEITCKLLKRGIKIMEVPISYVGRTYAEGKKITWKDGFGALKVIFALRFGGR